MLWVAMARSSHFAPQRVWTSPQDVGLSGFVQVWQGDTFTCNHQGVLSIGNWGSTFVTGIINPQWADSIPGFKLLADGSWCSFQLGEWYDCFQKAWRCKGKDMSSWRSHGNLHFRFSNRWAFKTACVERTFRWCHLEKPSSGVHSEPTWLKAWRQMVLRLKNMVKGIIWQMVQCTHGKCRRYGNAHGRFATCLQCGLKWVWNNDLNKWEDRLLKEGQKAGSKGRSTPLQPLPAPSLQTIAASSQAALQATSKSGQAGSFEDRPSGHRLSSPAGSMDQLLRHGLQAGPLDGVPVPGGLQCDGGGPSLHAHSPQLLRGSLLQRGGLQAGQAEDAAGSRHEKVGAPGGAGRGELDHRGETRSTTGRKWDPHLWWRRALRRDFVAYGADLRRLWKQRTRSTWLRSPSRNVHRHRWICGNYLPDELYVQNWPRSMTWKPCSRGT